MTKLYGKNFTKRELLQRIGSVSQIGGLKNYVLNDGRAKGIETFNVMHESEHEYKEQVFNHKLNPDKKGNATVEIINHNLGFKVILSYRPDELPYLIQWKQMGEGDYALGLEPSTWKTRGRAEARKQGELIYLEPGEKKAISIELEIEEILNKGTKNAKI